MSTLSAILVIALVYALGDVISNKTKALLSMMLVAGLVFLVGFWVGIPLTLFDDSKMTPVAMALISVLMIHMGSFMKFKDLKDEWKTVLVALLAIVVTGIALYYLGGPVMGRQTAIAAIGPIAGGVVATLITNEAVKAHGLEALAVFATLLLVIQSFVGLPIASFCLRRAAKKLLSGYRSGAGGVSEVQARKASDPEVPTFRLFPATPEALRTPFILFAKTALVAWLAVAVAALGKNVVHPYIVALVFGIVFYEIGFIEHRILDKANSGGLALFIMLVPVFMSLSKATPAMVASLIVPIIVTFVISVIALFVVAVACGKILRYPWEFNLAIGATCMFGFPGTFIISQEVAESQGESAEEKKYLLAQLLPKMLVAGFTTVTVGSVILAGIVVKFL